MIDQILAETRKSLRSWRRHKIIIAIGIVSPFFFTFIFTQVFTFTGGSGFPLAVIVEEEPVIPGSWTSRFLDTLDAKEGTIPYFDIFFPTLEEAETLFAQRQIFVIVWIPHGFEENLTLGQPVTIRARINNIHEDLSKNIRLGLESRIWRFVQLYQLDTGNQPGITFTPTSIYETELPRPSYMIWGVLVWVTVFTSLFYGGTLGAEEKDKKTMTELTMSHHGLIYARMGKTLATMIISAACISLLLVLNLVMYGITFPDLLSFGLFWVVFLCLTFLFSLLGVIYGLKVGDFRLVPVPAILISLTLWVVSGAINPLEFSVGAEVFRFLPTAAGIRILTAVIFQRGLQYFLESVIILGMWVMIGSCLFGLLIAKNLKAGI
ncbi:MAG: ABC transporter permease [Promethearchaeota archaeon]